MNKKEMIQKAVIKQCKDASFTPDVAFTLTLDLNKGVDKEGQDIYTRKNKAEKIAQKWMTTDADGIKNLYLEFESMFKKLYGKMAKKCYGSNYKRLAKINPDKALKMFASTERGRGKMFHLHGAVNLPEHVSFKKFKKWLLKIWSSFYIGSKQQHKIEPIDDVDTWIEYISKDFHKDNGQGYISYSKL